jgi:DNA-binding transcriptional LysR family regulator
MVVAAAPTHTLARKSLLEPADLAGQAFVAFDPDLPIRRDIDRSLREWKVTLQIVMHFDNIQMVKEAVALGTAISILPARAMEAEIQQGRLVGIPINSDLVRPLGIIHRRRKRFHRAAQAFLELLQNTPPAGAVT